MTRYAVTIFATTAEALRALRRFDLDLHERSAHQVALERFAVPGILTQQEIDLLRADGYEIEVTADLDQVAHERMQQVLAADRAPEAPESAALELLDAGGYMSPPVITAVLTALAAANPTLLTQITLPNTTWEGRACTALRLRAGAKPDRIGVLVIGGVHAREWGGSEICIGFLSKLINAYKSGVGLPYGGKAFSAAQVKTIVESLDIFIFPLVNPDGKNYSQTVDTWWRKNRNPSGAVDVNRNFDFLWSSGIGTSTSTGSETYKGSAPFSEPETRNVRYLLDTYPNIRYLVDVHSYSQLIMYPWGDDTTQSSDPAQNFANPAFNGARGSSGGYAEFQSTTDLRTHATLGKRMRDALFAVRGQSYTLQPSYSLYGTSGTSQDYAFSRHFFNPAHQKVFSYCIEFGQDFIPPIAEMQNIVVDVSAALTELCWAVNSDTYSCDNPSDTGAVPTSGAFWNSPDIWVRNAEDGVAAHQNTIRGQDNFLYARVHNRGLAEARDVTVRFLIANYPGTEFVYPKDWIPLNPAGSGTIAAKGTYLIGEATVPILPSGGLQVVHVRWKKELIPPDPSWHPCLLGEITPEDGPPLTGNHVWQSNNLVQKNITIVQAHAGELVTFPFTVGSLHPPFLPGRLVIEKVRMPRPVTITLDVGDRALLDAYAPGSTQAVVHGPAPEQVRTGGVLSEAGGDVPVLAAPHAAALAGCSVANVGGRPVLKLTRAKRAQLPLFERPGGARAMVLSVTLPRAAQAGEVYELHAVQYDEVRRAVGGVVLEIHVTR